MSRISFYLLPDSIVRKREQMSFSTTLNSIIRSVFSRWTALQLAVSHSMGGLQTEEKYEAFIDAFTQYLMRNARPNISLSSLEQNIQEYLEEVMDEEFNTELDDGSSIELSKLIVRYFQMIQEGKLAEVNQELQIQQATASSLQSSVRTKTNDMESSSSESDDGEDEEMLEEQPTQQTKPQSMDVDEDGWTTVHRRGGGRK